MKRVSPKEAQELMGAGWTYLDVRSVPEFEQGHPAGAVNVPLMHTGAAGMTPNEDFLAVVGAAFPKETKLVVGCQAGGRSARAAQLLEAAGYSELADQRAGFGGSRDGGGRTIELGWAAQGLPVNKGQPAAGSYEALRMKLS
jgi:rhodanese-related sulfurtransferase